MMKLETIFAKPIHRKIEGVIKADDNTHLRIELEEYILTKEVEKRLEEFLDAYNDYDGVNGVWISGFFGSGKSHLLKMLSLLLEKSEIDGKLALDWFLPKCNENEILKGDLKRAVDIPSQSILFNIDQKADVISKQQFDALLAVFVKVFNESLGYYGKQGYIAQFERDLDSRNLYITFKKEYQVIAGKPWERGREQALLESKNIAQAYAQVTGEPETVSLGILDKYRKDYRVSIEDFAEEVKQYIDQQSPKFRLNFFVDEVGQYIADNVKLMTNLQTIAESLATKCQGRAWVIVTAQEDMDAVIGEMGRQQSNDFSKIQDRFSNRMKLTSQDVKEVITKRLLLKNDQGIGLLADVYHQQANNFKTLFDFGDGSSSYRNFQDSDDFIHTYPFIPYQFTLFQSAIRNLSVHNAFEGRHSSVGERSMLGVFQEVVQKICDRPVGQLATFDQMFEGISSTLKSGIRSSITRAENNLDSNFAIQILKALFLVKYVKEFKPTVRNLSVLMLESFDTDIEHLQTSIQESLNLLENETYIQRNGDLYEYLTDEEKDVEQEIKNTDVDLSIILDELHRLVFDSVIKQKKIRYGENAQDYSFSRKLDNHIYGREHELSIHLITPFNNDSENLEQLQMQSLGRDELLVILPSDARLIVDLQMFKQTEKYVQQNISVTQQDNIKRILSEKNIQNQNRRSELLGRVEELLSKASLYIAGTEFEVGGEDSLGRIIKGFHELIARVYPNLKMLKGISYKEEMIQSCLKFSEDSLFGNDINALDEPEREILSFIQRNNNAGLRSTVKAVIENFEKKPYGWDLYGVLCNLAKLCARAKLEVWRDGNLLENVSELDAALKNTRIHGNVLLNPQAEYSNAQARQLKEFVGEFFDQPSSSGEAKAIAKEVQLAFTTLRQNLRELAAQEAEYPFLKALRPVLETLDGICGQAYGWYLTDLAKQEDDLFDLKEQVIDPIRAFMGGYQKDIYREGLVLVRREEANFSYLATAEPQEIRDILQGDRPFSGNQMQMLKGLIDSVQAQVDNNLKLEIESAQGQIRELESRLRNTDEFSQLTSEQQQSLMQPFEDICGAIAAQSLIAVVRDKVQQFENQTYSELLSRLTSWAEPKLNPTSTSSYGTGSGSGASEKTKELKTEYVARQAVKVSFGKAYLADEADVNAYLQAMREALIAEIQQGKRIQI